MTAPGASLVWATGPLLRVEPERAAELVDLDALPVVAQLPVENGGASDA